MTYYIESPYKARRHVVKRDLGKHSAPAHCSTRWMIADTKSADARSIRREYGIWSVASLMDTYSVVGTKETPLPAKEKLVPNDGHFDPEWTARFQSIIGSVGYAANLSRHLQLSSVSIFLALEVRHELTVSRARSRRSYYSSWSDSSARLYLDAKEYALPEITGRTDICYGVIWNFLDSVGQSIHRLREHAVCISVLQQVVFVRRCLNRG